MNRLRTLMLLVAVLVIGDTAARAHVTINSGPATSGAANIVTFQIAHGCPGLNSATETAMYDTKSLTINIPADVNGNNLVTSIRPVPSGQFSGNATVAVNGQNKVTSVTWSKPDAQVATTDVNFYTLQLRFTPSTDGTTVTPAPTFSQIAFTAVQVCEDPVHHTTATVYWDSLKHADTWQTGTVCHADTDCTTGTTCDTTANTCMKAAEPAPTLNVVAARQPGWNHYSITTHIDDPSVYFADAQIVWMLTSQEGCTTAPCAYSANPAIMTAITATAGVTAATGGIHPGGDIWVKY